MINDCFKEEYNQFLKHIKSTWGNLKEDFIKQVHIDKILVSNNEHTVEVYTYLKENNAIYYNIKDGQLVEAVYTGEAIKTTYTLNYNLVLHLIFHSDILNDLGLNDVEVICMDYVDGLSVDNTLSEKLHGYEESYAY